jgi:hypothetical protein
MPINWGEVHAHCSGLSPVTGSRHHFQVGSLLVLALIAQAMCGTPPVVAPLGVGQLVFNDAKAIRKEKRHESLCVDSSLVKITQQASLPE